MWSGTARAALALGPAWVDDIGRSLPIWDEMTRSARLGVDIGGTFTDLVLVDETTGELLIGKALTTPDDPSLAVQEVIRDTLSSSGLSGESVRTVIHGTTLVANAIIERRGDRTALITTKGFRDALEIAREHRFEMYDLLLELPKPLVPRYLRLELDERVLADGTVLRPLDIDEARRLVKALADAGVEAVAISLLHAYKNPEHERLVADLLAEMAPQISVSLSSEVAPEIKEYQRTSTTVLNVYVQGLVSRYLGRLEERLRSVGVDGELLLMLSSGGVGTVEIGRRFPVRLLESGPAGGALAAARLGEIAGKPDVLSFDMGGTTAKLCIIEDGQPLTTPESEVARAYRFYRGSGFPVRVPVIDMVEIGAGGGSIARIDSLGMLRVGPESAGAEPGPVCYARGGVEPTVTDADLILGYLDPRFFLGGRVELDVEAARVAVANRIAEPLGMSIEEAAWGIHRIVNENMANAARVHATERGKDHRRFPMFAFGGAGPVHAYGVGRLLGSPAVLVPIGAGVGSAIGFLTAPLVFDFVRTMLSSIDAVDWARVTGLLSEMEAEGVNLLERSGVTREEVAVRRSAEMRYVGQGHEVHVPLPAGRIGLQTLPAIQESFDRVYEDLYGRTAAGMEIEALNWRVSVNGPRPSMQLANGFAEKPASLEEATKGERPVYFAELGDYRPTRVVDRYALTPAIRFPGPAIIEERESTIVAGPGTHVSIDPHLNVNLTYDGSS